MTVGRPKSGCHSRPGGLLYTAKYNTCISQNTLLFNSSLTAINNSFQLPKRTSLRRKCDNQIANCEVERESCVVFINIINTPYNRITLQMSYFVKNVHLIDCP